MCCRTCTTAGCRLAAVGAWAAPVAAASPWLTAHGIMLAARGWRRPGRWRWIGPGWKRCWLRSCAPGGVPTPPASLDKQYLRLHIVDINTPRSTDAAGGVPVARNMRGTRQQPGSAADAVMPRPAAAVRALHWASKLQRRTTMVDLARAVPYRSGVMTCRRVPCLSSCCAPVLCCSRCRRPLRAQGGIHPRRTAAGPVRASPARAPCP